MSNSVQKCVVMSGGSGIAGDFEQVGAVVAVLEAIGICQKLRTGDPALAERDLLKAGDPQPLPALQSGDKIGGVQHGRAGAGIEPGEAASELLDKEFTALEITPV